MSDKNFLENFVETPASSAEGAEPQQAAVQDGAQASVSGNEETQDLMNRVVTALSNIYDPEIPVNIYELGLIYDVQIEAPGKVDVKMTLTTPHCPVAETMPAMVEGAVAAIEGVEEAKVELTWEPPWGPEMMSEVARLELGFM